LFSQFELYFRFILLSKDTQKYILLLHPLKNESIMVLRCVEKKDKQITNTSNCTKLSQYFYTDETNENG